MNDELLSGSVYNSNFTTNLNCMSYTRHSWTNLGQVNNKIVSLHTLKENDMRMTVHANKSRHIALDFYGNAMYVNSTTNLTVHFAQE